MIGGYLATLGIAMIPPLWRRLMVAKLRDWDREQASAEERELVAPGAGRI
jgi:alkane 1-monooxygenase